MEAWTIQLLSQVAHTQMMLSVISSLIGWAGRAYRAYRA